jgi:SAM-dependent methyltransferase
MKWDFGAVNPADPFTRFSSYKWLATRSLARLIGRAARHASGRLLDVGCGDKRFAHYFAGFVDRYVALDYPTTFLGKEDNVDVFGTALDLPFKDEYFDTVVSFEVLEHVTDSRRMLTEIRRVLKPGGALILTTPFLWGEHCQPHDYFRFTVYGLRSLLMETGFEIREQRRANGFWTFWGQRFCYYLWPVFGRHLGWMHTSLSFMILICASLLEQLDPVDTEYTTSAAVAIKTG